MSAILAVRKQGSIELLTDSAAICGGTGKVLYFGKKQVATAIPNCAIAATGATRTCVEFGRLATGISTFDALVERADGLWRDSLHNCADIHDQLIGLQALALAGWSDQREQLELYSLATGESGLSENLTSMATGPTEETSAVLVAFVEALEADLEAFTADAGIALFEELRQYPRQFKDDTAPAIGGAIHHTTVTRDGTSTVVVHRWPDRVGEKIRGH